VRQNIVWNGLINDSMNVTHYCCLWLTVHEVAWAELDLHRRASRSVKHVVTWQREWMKYSWCAGTTYCYDEYLLYKCNKRNSLTKPVTATRPTSHN